MKKFALSFLLVPALFLNAVAQTTPSAEEVLDKYVAAIGGKDFLKTINDIRIEMSSEFNGNTMLLTQRKKLPNKYSMVMNANGMEVMRMTSDGSKVMSGGMRGTQTIDGAAAQAMILQNALFPELYRNELGLKTTVDGIEKVDGKDAYKVTFASADGAVTWSDFYDVASGLKVQTVSKGRGGMGMGRGGQGGGQGGQGGGQGGQGGGQGGQGGGQGGQGGGQWRGQGGGDMTQTVKYADYKDFKGLKYPTTITQGGGQFQRESTVDKVKINDNPKESEFKVEQ